MKFSLLKLFVLVILFSTTVLNAQTTIQWGPDGYVKIENGSGGMSGDIEPGDRFSRDHDQAGDINGDGIIDLVIGARSDDDGATDAGAIYIAFLNTDGTVQSNQKISMLEGGFNETLLENNFFGYGVAGIGDYDNDGIPDVAVSAPASTNRALYIIHLNSDGTVKNYVKNSNIIAQGLSAIGDINNDGRCICKDSTAFLATSTELSTAYTNECSSSIITNINDLNTENQVIVFPNPTNSELFLKIDNTSLTQDDKISIYSLMGTQIYSAEISSSETKINLSYYPKGIYFLVATINGASKTFKILKE